MTISARPFATCSGFTAALFAGLLLTGCATQKTAPATRTSSNNSVTTTTTSDRATPSSMATSSAESANTSDNGARTTTLPERTGIPACDDYLASYIGCHRAAEIFAPGQLQDRYQAMRNSLLRDSQNPDVRPQLAARCNSLATQLRTALHGKACEVSPTSASSTTP